MSCRSGDYLFPLLIEAEFGTKSHVAFFLKNSRSNSTMRSGMIGKVYKEV